MHILIICIITVIIMTQSSPEHSQQSRSFETIVPPGVGGAIEALRAIATQLGLDGKVQIIPISEQADQTQTHYNSSSMGSPIADERFHALSQEMYGNPDYGASALTYLDTKRQRIYVSGNRIDQWVPPALLESQIDGVPFQPSQHEEGQLSEPDLRKRVALLFDTSRTRQGDNFPSPFNVAHGVDLGVDAGRNIDSDSDTQDRRLKFVSGAITDDRLRKYVDARGIKEHNMFQGAVGKILDIISYVADADIAPPTSSHRDFQGDLMDTQELRRRMISSGLSQVETSTFFTQRLRDAVFKQLDTLTPYKHGELVIEGKLNNKGDAPLIAISSLAALRQSYKPDVRVGDFLQQFVGKNAK